MIAHTPSPWRASQLSLHIMAPIEAGGYAIARMDDLEEPAILRFGNATLICAAPELLSALRAILATASAHDRKHLSPFVEAFALIERLDGAA